MEYWSNPDAEGVSGLLNTGYLLNTDVQLDAGSAYKREPDYPVGRKSGAALLYNLYNDATRPFISPPPHKGQEFL